MINEVEIGGQLVPRQSFEAISEISSNKTLMVQKLTSKPTKLEPIKGLKTLDDVFNHFKPGVEVEFEKEDGSTQKEQINFKSLLDFKKEGIIEQSNFLKDLQSQQDACNSIIKKLKTNKILKAAIQDPEAKKNLIQAMKALINEIDQAK